MKHVLFCHTENHFSLAAASFFNGLHCCRVSSNSQTFRLSRFCLDPWWYASPRKVLSSSSSLSSCLQPKPRMLQKKKEEASFDQTLPSHSLLRLSLLFFNLRC
jgi:hypothetical protein